MKKNILSEYSESPYIVIGLESTDNLILATFNNTNSNEIKYLFNNIDDCENFITKHQDNEKIILVISSHISGDESARLQKYSQLDAMYSYYRFDDSNGEFICIYKKVEDGNYSKIFRTLFENLWFLLGVVFVIIFAYLCPNLGASNGPFRTQYTVKIGCVFLIFLLSSLSLPLRHLAIDILNYRLHLSTQFYNLIFISFVVFGFAVLLAKASINAVLITGMVLMGCMPTANSINILVTKYCGGNEAGTLLNIIFGNVIGIFLSPALILMFATIANTESGQQSFNMSNYTGVIVLLSGTVLLPIVIGQIITFFWTEQMMWAKIKFHFAEINGVLLLLVIWAVLCDLFQSNVLKTVHPTDLLIIIMFNALLFIIFLLIALYIATLPNFFICRQKEIEHDHQPLLKDDQSKSPTLIQRWRFNHADTITFMFCGSTKTLSLGVPLITAMYPDASSGYVGLVTLPLILYDVEQIIISSVAIIILQRFFPANTVNHQ